MSAPPPQALTKRSTDAALMPAPPATKRQKRPAVVLDEEEYSQGVSDIIARDYFPGLRETQAQNEYMAAIDSGDRAWRRAAGRNLTQVMTPGPDGRRRMARATSLASRSGSACSTPRGYTGETPGQTPRLDSVEDVKPAADINMSLTAFQAKYTSEDNESFNKILDKQNADRAAKYAFLYAGNKTPTSRQIAYRAQQQKLIEQNGAPSSSAVVVRNADGEERTALAVARPSQDLDARVASLDSFRNTQGPRNSFMFEPDGVQTQALSTPSADNKREKGPLQAVSYANTRFSSAMATTPEQAVPPSPSLSAIDRAILGRSRPTESEPGYTGAETPRVNGYAFVDAEPTPSELGDPVSDEEADAAEHEAALQLLPKVDTTGPNPFTISDTSERENLHRRLVEKADADRRQGGRLDHLRSLGITPGRTPTPKFSFTPSARDRAASMTPAAKRLADTITTPRRRSGLFGGKGDWTPTSKAKKSS